MTTEYQGVAIYKNTQIYADEFEVHEWAELKANYKIGEITMPCCNAFAIPKNSPNGLQFFAHHNDECSTAPETIWHRETKAAIQETLLGLGINADLEVTSEGKRRWQADVYFQYQKDRFAIEIQRSYQHLDEYLRRQARYESDGVKALWVLCPKQYMTLTRSMKNRRLKDDFKGEVPKEGFQPCLPNIPIVFADGEPTEIKGAGLYRSSVRDWLLAVIKDRFRWQDGQWKDMR